jgi:hypothetical protein
MSCELILKEEHFIEKTDQGWYPGKRAGLVAGGMGEVRARKKIPRHGGVAHQDKDNG